jgi:hypothetical protein
MRVMSNFAIHIKNRTQWTKVRKYLIELGFLKEGQIIKHLKSVIGSHVVIRNNHLLFIADREAIKRQGIPIIIYPVEVTHEQKCLNMRKPRKRIKEDSLPLLSELNLTYKELFEGLGYKISNQLYRIKNKDAILTTLEKVLELQKRLLEK